MHLGFGLYKHMLDRDHYRFARQCGATHLVVHLTDYFGGQQDKANQPVGGSQGWGRAGSGRLWTLDYLQRIKKEINGHQLEWEAIENFDPAMWHDVLLDGPRKQEQMELIKEQIRVVGKAGIPVFGYNFSLAGVAGRIKGPFARGGAESVGMQEADERPVPKGMVWNMVYDETDPGETQPRIGHDELWQRLHYFLEEIIPVAEEAGVILAAHPDDPPLPYVRQTPRLVYQSHLYQKLIDMVPSESNKLEFCLGTLAEMPDDDVYQATDRYSSQQKIAYVHFRNVTGKVPEYKEVFVDEGDIDMLKVLQILKKNKYQGMLIPDHTPQMTCGAPWHAGMAYAMGYMKAALAAVNG